MKVFSYIRVSGLGQVDKDGPVRQAESIESFCQKHSLISAATFIEEGVSGTIEAMDRPKFADMIAKIDLFKSSGEEILQVSAIVVERMDRLARDMMVSEFLLRECRNRGIKVFCADQGECIDMASDEGDPTRKMLRQILGAIAEWDKSVTVKKLRAARNRQRLNGHRCEGRKPYGNTDAEQKILEEISGCRLMERGSLKPSLSYTETATFLNAKGYKTRQGLYWNKDSVFSVHTQRRQKHKLKRK